MIEFLKNLFKPNFCKCHKENSEAFGQCFSPTTKLDTNNPPLNSHKIIYGENCFVYGELPPFKSLEKKYERDSRGRFKKKGT